MMQYDLVIWDLDGTLLDTSEGILSSARYAIEKENLPVPTEAVMKTYIGPPIQNSFMATLRVTKEKSLYMAEIFRQHYKKYDLYKACPYSGINNLLKAIRENGIKQAVATYKRDDYAYAIIEKFAMAQYMDCVCGSDFEGKLTKTDIIRNAIENIGIKPSKRIVMIGDTDNDLFGAEHVGIDFIGVKYGFGFKSQLDGIKVASNIDDLRNMLLMGANA